MATQVSSSRFLRTGRVFLRTVYHHYVFLAPVCALIVVVHQGDGGKHAPRLLAQVLLRLEVQHEKQE